MLEGFGIVVTTTKVIMHRKGMLERWRNRQVRIKPCASIDEAPRTIAYRRTDVENLGVEDRTICSAISNAAAAAAEPSQEKKKQQLSD